MTTQQDVDDAEKKVEESRREADNVKEQLDREQNEAEDRRRDEEE